MTQKTPWEEAAELDGATPSERYLTWLARKAFLSLWSYSNPYTDEGRVNGKGDGKELCDLLVVFGNNVFIFSDKHCEFPDHKDINVAWSRWYRKAVEKSAKQLLGAEKFVKAFPGRVFLDKDCKSPLPVSLPDASVARYFLVAVTRGSHDAGVKYWGGGGSGSLMLDTSIVGNEHNGRPFRIGFPLVSRRFIHVLDEMTVDVLLGELDTVPDIVQYLKEKEGYLCRHNFLVCAAGEEQLLARYMCTVRGGQHAFPEIPVGTNGVVHLEGDWEFYASSPQRAAKRAADAPSYMWDSLIEYQSSFIRANTSISMPFINSPQAEHEQVVRALADESRYSRRFLSESFSYALSQSVPGKKFARVVLSGERKDRAYVFLTIPMLDDMTYEQYREIRSSQLMAYCTGIKLRFPFVVEAVGISSEPFSESLSSQDFLYVMLGDAQIDGAGKGRLLEMMEDLSVLQSPSFKTIDRDSEFPMPFDFAKRPGTPSAGSGSPVSRATRKALSKRGKKKRR